MMTPPMGPTLLVVYAVPQESRIADRARPRIPALTLASSPQGDANAVHKAPRLLVNAESLLIQCQWGWSMRRAKRGSKRRASA